MRIDSSGNVGIGTSSPQAELHVHDPAGLAKIRLSGTASDADTFEIYQGTLGVTNGGLTIRDVEASANRLVINSSGNVGIGTSSPLRRLHVKNTGDSFVATFEGATNSYTSWVNTSGTAGYIGSANGLGSGGVGDLAVRSEANLIFLTNAGSERMRIDSGGSVAIGLSSAGTKLDVGGTIRSVVSGGTPILYLNNGTTQHSIQNTSGAFTFFNNGTERMRIDSSGNVGIGTTDPDCMLHLSGGNEQAKIKFQVGTASADKFKIYASTAGRLYVNSDATNTGVYLTYNGTSWTSNSDETLKDNITSLGTVGDKLKNYRTSYFTWKADTETPPKRNIGFIAQDWETDFPEVVTKKEGETLGMQYTETIPILLKYIQELEARITALEG
jgi:hypothetical protein